MRTSVVTALGAALGWTALLTTGVSASPVFTGDAPFDFAADPAAVEIVDLPFILDVGLPLQARASTISGWDMRAVWLHYDHLVDRLYVGIETFGIGGDADGDGAPGGSSAWLVGNGGLDWPHMAGSESVSMMIDTNEDGVPDVIAGVSAFANIDGFSVNTFAGSPFAPSLSYGAPLPYHTGTIFGSPSPAAPHVEFTIEHFSELPGFDGTIGPFRFQAYMGSLVDDGIGEDFMPNIPSFSVEVCLDADQDGYTTCGGDCDDRSPRIAPRGSDMTCDGVDEDCDGVTDDDYPNTVTTCGIGACRRFGGTSCVDGQVVSECNPAPAAPEDPTCDGVDDDCDGETDEDYVAQRTTCGMGACAVDGIVACIGGQLVDTCVPGTGALADTTCDGVDDDCDGIADEDCSECNHTLTIVSDPETTLEPSGDPAVPAWAEHGVWSTISANLPNAQWLWRTYGIGNQYLNDTQTFRREFILAQGATAIQATLAVAADNRFDLWVNGILMSASADNFVSWQGITYVEIGQLLKHGRNVLEFEVHQVGEVWPTTWCNPAGLIYQLDIEYGAPGSPESCDGIDNNCDGQTDEGDACLECASPMRVAAYEVRDAADDGSSQYPSNHAFMINGFYDGVEAHVVKFRWTEPGRLDWRQDGNARLTGDLYVSDLGGGPGALGQHWKVDITFVYRGQGTNGEGYGGPWMQLLPGLQGEVYTDQWHYFSIDPDNALFWRPGTQEYVTMHIYPFSHKWSVQLGARANGQNLRFGMSGWFVSNHFVGNDIVGGPKGDLNLDLTQLPTDVCSGCVGSGDLPCLATTAPEIPVGTCCTNNGTPSCDRPAVAQCVCQIDSYCCTTAWDWVCSNMAFDSCGLSGCGAEDPTRGSCGEVHIPSGCARPSLEACVCAHDTYCCVSAWDSVCTGLAANECAGK